MSKAILIVDDEPQIAQALTPQFEQKGCRVMTAATAQAARDQLRALSAEVVLLDLGLPDCAGLELLSQLKRQLPELRIVVISGTSDEQTIREALERGASDYLTKPFDFDSCFYAAMGIGIVDLDEIDPDPEAIARVPLMIARQYRVVPLRMRGPSLELAMVNPLDVRLLDELPMLLGTHLVPMATVGGDIDAAIERCYAAATTGRSMSAPPHPGGPAGHRPLGESQAEAGVVGFINELIQHAHANRASDLHVGASAQGPWIQERVDGMLYDVPIPPQIVPLYNALVSRVKIMANLDIAEHRMPQDGRIWFAQDATRLDLRVSVLPTLRGENLVIRILEPSQILRLDQLGLTEEQLHQTEQLLAKPTGLLLVTGPTGSGKSTSLYAFLSKLNTGRASIVTIEDPIEHELPRVTQIQIQPKIGLTFAGGLRAMLRHDPDIIMVGEIRDQETASLAIRAALTGHLVLATLHTNDAASGITRLLDLDIEPFLLCSTLCGILSQRLIRVLCTHCRESTQVDASALAAMGVAVTQDNGLVRVWRAGGCIRCRKTGYYGRTGVFELFPVDHRIRSLIIKRTSSTQIRQSAIAQGMSSLWQSGWQKMQAGITSLEELGRVLPREVH